MYLPKLFDTAAYAFLIMLDALVEVKGSWASGCSRVMGRLSLVPSPRGFDSRASTLGAFVLVNPFCCFLSPPVAAMVQRSCQSS